MISADLARLRAEELRAEAAVGRLHPGRLTARWRHALGLKLVRAGLRLMPAPTGPQVVRRR
jgi:hypothetical protein